jgi:multidrug efflux pump subunit AcrB
MTTLTMITGMLPTALSMTAGSETRVSMAWVVIGGLLSSTIFTLLIIPVIFLYFETRPLTRFLHIVAKHLKRFTKVSQA